MTDNLAKALIIPVCNFSDFYVVKRLVSRMSLAGRL